MRPTPVLTRVAALLVLWLTVLALPAAGQGPTDYGNLTGGTETPPAATTPVAAPPGPDLEAYGRIQNLSPGAMIDSATRQVDIFQQRLSRILRSVPTTGASVHDALAKAAPDGDPLYFLGVAVFLTILLIIGRGGAMIFAAYVARPIMVGIQRPNPQGLSEKLPVLATRVGLSAAAAAITLLIAVGVGASFFPPHPPTRRTAVVLLGAYAAWFMVDTTWRMVISPYLPNYRVPRLADADAVRMYRHVSLGTTVGIAGIALSIWLDLLEVAPDTAAFLRIMIGTITTAVFISVVLRNRHAVTGAILGGVPRSQAAWPAALASVLWLPAILAYLLFSWGAASFRLIMGLGTPLSLVAVYSVFLVSIVVYAVTVFAIERLFARSRRIAALNRGETPEARPPSADEADLDGDGDEESGGVFRGPDEIAPPPGSALAPAPVRRSMRTFEDLARRGASLFALGVGGFIMLRLWVGPEIFDENSVWNLAQDIADTAFFGYLLFHGLRIWMDRKIEAEGTPDLTMEEDSEGGAARAASRLGTLLPLVRGFVLFVVAASVALLIASRLGVNVAPLLGGAGIVGLAIGFGAQTLVRDILSGMFFLLDDAFRKGEYIDVGSVKGTVEKISIRSFQLRHHLGALHTIPFGEIHHLTNYSRDWVIMKLPLRLTYDTDVEKVRKIIKKLGQELLEHPIEGPKFVQPLKSQGVYMMEDSAMIIRVKFMTRPGDQWTTRKLVYQRIREVFEQEGITFAHREVTVRVPGIEGRQLGPGEVQMIGAAARRAVDDADALAGPQPSLAEGR